MSTLLANETLISLNGTVDGGKFLKDKAVLLLFSSVWCPDCKPFCGIVKNFLKQLKESNVEVVWVSSDHTEKAATDYFKKSHEWLMIPYDSPMRNELKRKYGFCANSEKDAVGVKTRKGGIPTLALVTDVGALVCTHRDSNMMSETQRLMSEYRSPVPENAHIEPNGVPVNNLECAVAFNGLTKKEKNYSYHLSRVCWEGAKICLLQTSPESPFIFELLTRAFEGCDVAGSNVLKELSEAAKAKGISKHAYRGFLVYSAAFFNNMGNYRSFGDTKIIPGCGCTPKIFEQIIKLSNGYKKDSKSMDDLLNACFDGIYSLGPREKELALFPDGVSTYVFFFFSNSIFFSYEILYLTIFFWNIFPKYTYYSSSVTREEIAKVQKFLDKKGISPYNTRLFKTAEDLFVVRTAAESQRGSTSSPVDFEGLKISVTYGDHRYIMQRIVEQINLAKEYAANDNQISMIEKFSTCFSTGNMQAHIEGSRDWIKDKSPAVESYIGFIESYQDPFGVRGEWEGFVAVVNREISTKFQVLVDTAPRLLTLLPWPESFEKDQFLRPDFTSLDVLSFGSSGIPAGINIPNYDSVRQNDGFKNVSLGNVLSSRMKPKAGEVITFLRQADQANYQKLVGPAFEVQVGLHELLGHGSGKLFMSPEDAKGVENPLTNQPVNSWYLPGETWDTKFPGFGSSYEECRAECVGIYLCTNKEALSIFGHEGKEADDVMYVNWLNMARAGLLALQYYSPENKSWGQAHMWARFVILRVLLEAGQDFVKIKAGDEKDSTCVVLDRSKIISVGAPAIGKFLNKLQVYKATADCDEGKKMYDFYSTVDWAFLELRNEVMRRRKPRPMWVQANISKQDENVEMKMFEPTVEGVIQSFSRRFPSSDPELISLAISESKFHKY